MEKFSGYRKINIDKSENQIYRFWKGIVILLFIVGFTTLTAIKISSFHALILFSLYPIIVTMFFIDRYTMMFISGTAVSISLWLLGYYHLMPWYFVIYGLASFVAYPFAISNLNTTKNKPIQSIYIPSPSTEENKNTIYVMYSMVLLILGETIIDWLLSGLKIALTKFPIHIVEGALSGTLAIITIGIIELIKNKRSQSSSYNSN